MGEMMRTVPKQSSIVHRISVSVPATRSTHHLLPHPFLVILALLSFLLIGAIAQGIGFDGLCPVPECYCGLDNRNRLEVHCSSGELNEIPTSRMSPDIEVIRITAPKHRANHLRLTRAFRQFRKLEELHIVESNVGELGSSNFLQVSSLRLLNFTRNNINHLVDSNFLGLTNLESLILAENHISHMESQCFRYLTRLKVLDLSRNRVGTLVGKLFDKLSMLELLDLSDNELGSLNADVFRDIWGLKEFRCQRCQLRSIPSLWYSLLPTLRILDLRHNHIKSLQEGEFSKLNGIEEIYLDGNEIEVLGEDCFLRTRLKSLSLAYNGLTIVDRSAFRNATMHSLDLSGNKFESLNKLIFIDLKSTLTKLDLSRNPRLSLASLYTILTENTRLRWLSIARNNYEELPPDLFEDNRFLTHLNLSNNRLNDLSPQHFSNLSKLQVLDLSYNRLYGIKEEVLGGWDRINAIREIRLEGNPWACDLCHIPPLYEWLKNSTIFRKGCLVPNGPFCLRCRYPSNMYDKAILDIEESELVWCNMWGEEYGDESRFGLILGCIVLIILLIIVVVGILVRYRFWHSAHYYTHEETRMSGSGLTPQGEDAEMDYTQQYYATINGTHTKMISTIDKHFEGDPNFYPDLNINPLYKHPSP